MAVGDGTRLGYDSCIGIAEETTFGAKVDSFSYIEFNTESLKRNREERKLESINKSRDFIKRIQLNETIEGSLEVDLNPAADAAVYLMKQAMGGTVSSAVVTAGALQYLHTLNGGNMEAF